MIPKVSRVRGRPDTALGDICGLTLLALLLNLVHLGTKSIWLDEATSIAYARLDLAPFIGVLTRHDSNMALYYVLLKLWEKMFGESEVAVRSLSALCGALSVPALYLLGRRLFGRTVGVVAGLMLALNAFMVEYAQTARSYALLALLVTLSSYFLTVELELPSTRSRIGYVLTSTLAMYTHYFAGLVLMVHLGTVIALRRRHALKGEWIGVASAILLLCAPEALFAYRAGPGAIGWIRQPTLDNIRSALIELAGGSTLLLFALLAGGLYATISAALKRRYWPNAFVGAWLVIPFALCVTGSFVKPLFVPRYLIICVPALVLFGASALARLRRPVWVGALVVPLVWASATQLLVLYGTAQFENWREATRYVLGTTYRGDAISFFPLYARRPFEYYQRQAGVMWPVNVEGGVRLNGQRIWLVIRKSDAAAHQPQIRQLQASLTETRRLADRHEFDGVGVELYVLK